MKGHLQYGRLPGRVFNRGPSEYIAEALKLNVMNDISLKVLLKCEHGNDVPHKHNITYNSGTDAY